MLAAVISEMIVKRLGVGQMIRLSGLPHRHGTIDPRQGSNRALVSGNIRQLV
jgi:hypothetical protein